MAMHVDGGVLYTTLHNYPRAGARRAEDHKMAEWKADWWLGKTVIRKGVMWTVAGYIPGDKGGKLILAAPDGHGEHVTLTTANAALRKGTWTLM